MEVVRRGVAFPFRKERFSGLDKNVPFERALEAAKGWRGSIDGRDDRHA